MRHRPLVPAVAVALVVAALPGLASASEVPALLPAGRLAFSTAIYFSDGSGSGQGVDGLGTIGLDGTDQRTLTAPPGPVHDHSPEWSPDGRWLVAMRALDEPTSPTSTEIRVTASDGSWSEVVGYGIWPAWSPDGRTLVWSSYDPAKPGLLLLPIDPTGEVPVTDPGGLRYVPTPRQAFAVSWSPSGQELAVWVQQQDAEHERDLWQADVATGQIRQLAVGIHEYGQSIRPAWHPSGDQVAVVAKEAGGPWPSGTFIVEADGSGWFRIRPEAAEQEEHGWVSWAPNGLSLAIESNAGLLLTSPTGLLLRSLGADRLKSANTPVWSPDGTHVYVVASDIADDRYKPELWAIPVLSDLGIRQLTTDSSVFPTTASAVDPGLALRVIGDSPADVAVAVADRLPDSTTAVLTTTASAPAATPLAIAEGSPLLETWPDAVPPSTLQALESRRTSMVWVVGQVSDAVEGQLRERGITTVRRLGGGDLASVAAAVAAAVAEHVPSSTVFLAPSDGAVEQAASAAVAGAGGAPLLLTGNGTLGSSTRAALERVGATHVYLTATSAVSTAVDDELRGMGIGVERLSGSDGAAAALRLAEAYAPAASMSRPVVVPEGSPDIGGPMLAASRSTVLLPAGDDPSDPVVHFVSAHSDAIAGVDLVASPEDLTPGLEMAIERAAHDPGYQPPAAPSSETSPTAPTQPAPPAASTGPAARSIDQACPTGRVPDNPFTDVPTGSTHERAISCLVWWKVANGRTATSYDPVAGVTRDAMAAFVARTILQAKPGALPDNPADAFGDDSASAHHNAINQLAAVGIVTGTGSGGYSPTAGVTRGQMAKFLANAARHVLGTPLPADSDLFSDDDTSPFQDDINRVAQAGLTGGRADGTYNPLGPVRRDQMGSFLARTLDLFVANGARLPN